MVLTRTTNHTYSHPFETVTLAFFLRYCSPQLNPFSAHVLSTDTLSSHVDTETGRLHTTRLHVKKSRMPKAIMKLLPKSITGSDSDKSAYVLETSVVDIKQGWMKSESENINWNGVLSVLEQQRYAACPPADQTNPDGLNSALSPRPSTPNNTYVTTTFSYRSTLGNRKQDKTALAAAEDEKEEVPRGRFGDWISNWSTKRVQQSIESIASRKTDDQMSKSRDGMHMVLERLRKNGVVAVLRELRRREGQSLFEQ